MYTGEGSVLDAGQTYREPDPELTSTESSSEKNDNKQEGSPDLKRD